MKKTNNNKRFRTFMIIIYQDDENYIEYIDFIVKKRFKTHNMRYLGITHDKDVNDDGVIKKNHDHIVLYFDNPRTIKSLSDELDLPMNYIEAYSSVKTALLYLLHYNQGDKPQYDISDTFGDLQSELRKYISNNPLSEEDRVCLLLDLIDGYYKYTSYSVFLRDVCKNGLYDILRRNNYMFIKILDKHNERFINYNS